jgi:hypothetical protein
MLSPYTNKQEKVCSMSVTLLVLWYLLQAYLAARRWTIAILLLFSIRLEMDTAC